MILLINPRLVVQKHDSLTTGIVYMPIGLAIFAGGLNKLQVAYKVIDLFGLKPQKSTEINNSWLFGEDLQKAAKSFSTAPSSVVIYANQAANHLDITLIIRDVSLLYPSSPIYLLENSQAVTAYSLDSAREKFGEFNIAGVITGTPDKQVNTFVNQILKLGLEPVEPTAFWEQFPINNYWNYKLSHGPQTESKYLPVLTSYGCPWGCSFCVVPATNFRKWISKNAVDVYEEIKSLKEIFGVTEFHIEDLNPSINTQRIVEIANKLKELSITWKIVAGTKAETLDSYETLYHLSQSGLNYFSFSPESGSKKVRLDIDKRFDVKHSFKLIRWTRKLNIRTQACFVLGMPSEKRFDRFKSLLLIRFYTILGLDEIAVFIISPMPGSKIYKKSEVKIEEISFSPSWRKDYTKLSIVRIYWYLNFLLLKLIFHPYEFIKSVQRFFSKKFELKMELAPHRSLQWKKWARTNHKRDLLNL